MRALGFIPMVGLLLSGCAGYHVGPVKPAALTSIEKVSVSAFENDTLEPRIEVLMANSLIKQLHQDGTYKVTSEQDADAIIEGVIERIERFPARGVKNDFYQTSEYTLAVVAKIKATEKRTGRILMERSITGNSSFFVNGRNTRTADVNKDERQSLPLAAEDLASRAVSYLSEGW
ncbi:MAG: LptE family protein [Verrucomicrobiota bacterium]